MGCPLLLEVSVFSFLLTVLDFLVIVLKVSFVLHLSFLVHVLLSLNFFFFVLMTEQKEKLSEVEQQLKKAEVAQRRRMQTEKAARESEVCSLFSWYLL